VRKIRVGVVGLNFGLEHVAALTLNERFGIAAICDKDAAKLGWLRGEPVRLDHEAAWYRAARTALVERVLSRAERLADTRFVQDFDALLAMEDVEAVFLALPCHVNAPFAVRTLRAGKHCFGSKPFALTRAQGEELVGTVRASDRSFMLGFQFRHSPLFKQVRRAIDAGLQKMLDDFWAKKG
jgi:predicted dehydrogenase